ncbi:hypothetical protein B0H16DRAFT_666522 [Mycena metata]|uniref:Uncharacterized protein n=1 Tax=Mycena metata TaxID=1033252 RepID=A0AAD7J5D7_9AGAR|nr:hypothetical protein B0H16DRAFT_666522 [Mycena metata]
MSFALNHEALPSELWLEIFAHLNERSYTTSYTPFQPLPGVGSEGDVKSAYTTVVLVCRNWHDWAISSLYRNLKIPDSHSMWTRNHPEYGRWVRRAILPSSLTLFASQASLSVEILGLCPNIEVLIRPQLSQFRFEFDPLCLQLPSLKRLEWWNGFNSLLSVLSAAPNLEYLFVGLAGFQAVNSIPAHAPGYTSPQPAHIAARERDRRGQQIFRSRHLKVVPSGPRYFGGKWANELEPGLDITRVTTPGCRAQQAPHILSSWLPDSM